MNYYDEEIKVGNRGANALNFMKVKRINNENRNTIDEDVSSDTHSRQSTSMPQNKTKYFMDADGLVQDNIDDADEVNIGEINMEEEENDDFGLMVKANSHLNEPLLRSYKKDVSKGMYLNELQQPNLSRVKKNGPDKEKLVKNETIMSDSESDKDLPSVEVEDDKNTHKNTFTHRTNAISKKWENLSIEQDVKDLFSFILKYTPQDIETVYHLESFIPDYVPAVGDTDAFLKVSVPSATNINVPNKLQVYLAKVGLNFLDEPSGNQTEPTLLNIKLRSILTGNYAKSNAISVSLVPTARTNKDIDKWISEVDETHKTQSVFNIPLRQDIEKMLIDWPRSFSVAIVNEAYGQRLSGNITLKEYIRTLCEHLNIQGQLETKADYLYSLQTVFALYLASNQTWE